MLIETEYLETVPQPASPASVHPLCLMIRDLRKAAGLSLAQFEMQVGIPAVVVGAYERGDRVPPLSKLDIIFGSFGYQLAAIPQDAKAVRMSQDMVADLRAIANQLEGIEVDPR